MILRQFLHSDPSAASYFVACAGHAAAVVDPVGDIAPYRALVEATGTKIRYAIDMHLHADHGSAARDLSSAIGADYVLFADAKVGFPFHGVRDGELLDLGNVSIKVLPTLTTA
jgi:hydroxyacylglutathione hydrolase